jgi:acetate kinase
MANILNYVNINQDWVPCTIKVNVVGEGYIHLGTTADFRDLQSAAKEGNHRAQLALDIFAYSVKKYIGSYAAALGGIDCLVFTAGVGENVKLIREKICEDLEFLGIELDKDKNNEDNNGKIRDLTKEGSRVKILVIPTNEELVIARDTLKVAFSK